MVDPLTAARSTPRNLGNWFAGLVAHSPAGYATIDAYLKNGVMPDLVDIKNPLVGGETRRLVVQFRADKSSHALPFAALSDGEKCFIASAVLLASNSAYGPLFCFWDEPDAHLAMGEVGHFVMALRRSFDAFGGQIIVTSHNAETIRRFSDENTLVLHRDSHLDPTRVTALSDLAVKGDLITALLLGDVP